MVSRWAFSLTVIIALLLCGSPATAQNMVANGDFDTNVAGWTPFIIPFDWDPSDWSFDPSSGSGLATNNENGYMHAGIDTCVDGIVAGQRYDLGGMIAIPTVQSGDGSAGFGVYWRDGVGCSGAQSDGGTSPYITETDTWIHIGKWNLEAPPGAQSAQVGIYNQKTSLGTDPFLSYHDGVYFGVFGGVFADGFETGSAGEWNNTAP